MEYSVLGDTVNTAARIVALTSTTKQPFLVSESIEGQSRQTPVYCLLAAADLKNAS